MANLFWLFLCYSAAGFVLEVLFAALTRSRKRDRKCFFLLPLCPVYGLGALAILALPQEIYHRPLLLFALGGLAATAVEFLTDWFYERCLAVRFWNYSALPWSVNGRVCLLFSGFWGVLSLGLAYHLHPVVAPLVAAIPDRWLVAALFLLVWDTLFTFQLLRRRGTTDALRWYAA